MLFCLTVGLTHAQNLSNIRYKVFSTQSDTIKLDSLSIVPGTVAVRFFYTSEVVDSNDFVVKAYESRLIWKKKPAADSVKIFFRVYPFSLAGEAYHKSYATYVKATTNSMSHPYVYTPETVEGKLIDFGNLDYNGSFSRSISLGNNQDVSLNSVFNLQLSGMLTHDIEITAAITDNNVPIQPEGNTQQLQEFDKIFIQIRKDQHKVIVGDFDLTSPDDYFMKFARKYEGGLYSGAFKIKKVGVFKTTVGGGIARGKFATNTLAITESNQGPYKLTGAAGETVITILANSEQVFVNGAKMDRGADRDYIIDYNLGEITFTPKRIISPDLRIVVEFQYANNNFTRSAAYMSNELQMKKGDIHFNVFSEQDSKGSSGSQSLTADQINFLTGLGDSVQKAYYKGFDTTTFSPGRVLYEMDVVHQFPFTFDSVFVYSTNPAKAIYTVNFSYVGSGKGNYNPVTSGANGTVYQWVIPYWDTLNHVFIPQGTYNPVIFLVTPTYQQLYTLGGDYKINKTNTISAEVAMSNVNQNLFAGKTAENLGAAAHVAYKGAIITKSDSINKKTESVTIDASYDFQQSSFTPIERFRNVEFNRDFNLAATSQNYNQHLAVTNIGYVWGGLGSINYHFRALLEDTVYHGYENGFDGNFNKNGFRLVFTNSYLNSTSAGIKTDFIRPKADISYAPKKFKGWRIGAQYDHEINIFKAANVDTMSANSYIWQNYKVYVGNADSSKNKYGFEFLMRYQQRPDSATHRFGKPYYEAQTVNFTGAFKGLKNQTLTYTLTYRHSKNIDSTGGLEPENFYLGRINYNFTALKGVFKSSTLYELGTGREQKTQISYQLSPNNTGDYIWIDYNHDAIQQTNEFVLSPYKTDSSYVRVVIPTLQYASVNTNQFNEVLNITPAAIWKNEKGAKKIVAMFSAFASVQVNNKTYVSPDKKVYQYFNPFPGNSNDTNVVSTQVSSRNTLYFNRLDPKYGAQYDFNYTRGQTYLTGGFENRVTQYHDIIARVTVVKAFTIQTTYTNGIKSDATDLYSNLNYKFHYNESNTDFSYQFKTFMRLDLKYDIAFKANPTDTVGKQTALINQFTLEGRYNKLKKSTITASFSYATIKYNDKGFANEQLQYAMLDGLQNGNNLVWSAGISHNLINNLQLTLSYDGRMTGFEPGQKDTMKPYHTGKAELRALF